MSSSRGILFTLSLLGFKVQVSFCYRGKFNFFLQQTTFQLNFDGIKKKEKPKHNFFAYVLMSLAYYIIFSFKTIV